MLIGFMLLCVDSDCGAEMSHSLNSLKRGLYRGIYRV